MDLCAQFDLVEDITGGLEDPPETLEVDAKPLETLEVGRQPDPQAIIP